MQIKSSFSEYSRYGRIFAGVYLAMVFYYLIRGAACGTVPLDCSRPLFLLAMPFYLLLIPLFQHFNTLLYAIIILTSSTLYAAGFYSLGEWIEQFRKEKSES